MITSFYTIQASAEAEYKEKGSRFLAFAHPVSSEEDVKTLIAEAKKKYFDARHHCYAYVLGVDKMRYRANDDGEPNHSAGDPILGQIRSKNLTNVLIIVVRYFGGTKLGVGGLITAYKTSAEEALKNAIVVEQQVTQQVMLTFGYDVTPHIMKLIKDFDLKIVQQQFDEVCRMEVEVLVSVYEQFLERARLMNVTGTKFQVLVQE